MGKEKKLYFIVFILAAISASINAGLPFIFSNIINKLASIKPGSSFVPIGENLILLTILLASNQLILFFNQKYSALSRIKMITGLRVKIFQHLLDLSVDYTERHRSGTVLQIVERGINDFFSWLMELSSWSADLIFETVLVLIILLIKLPAAGVLFLIIIPIMIKASLVKVQVTKKYRKRANKTWEHQSGYLAESIANLSTLKGMSSEKESIKQYYNFQQKIFRNRVIQFKYERRYDFARDSLGALSILLVVAYVAYMSYKGRLTPGDLFLITIYARNLIGSVGPISRFINATADYDITAGRLADLLETKPLIKDLRDSVELQYIETIEFKNVSFEYPDSKKGAIFNISFNIDAGKSVALVGPSGTGKSTITKLILRFYEPTSGSILINGKDISHYTQDSIRKNMAIVMQDVALFNTTVKENLQVANSKATAQEIHKSAEMANADEFIRTLTKGYNTLVGERGIKLSGGQKQRIAIARAILKNPNMIILDEATSALDSESEVKVQDALKKLLHHKMSLIIAHRLSTVRHVDEIIVLKNGRVYERGTHTNLLRKNGLYAKLFNIQSKTGKVDL
jgi:ABC-type multidrug transport system fused ATPase/permease subunit